MEKRIPNLDDFINESKFNELAINEGESYVYKEDSGAGRATWVLKVNDEGWNKIKDLFDKDGRPVTDEIKNIKGNKGSWTLYAQEYKLSTNDSGLAHKIYGVSGDYTFGNAPTFYQQKLRGNKKDAKIVLDWFIDKYLK